MPHFFGSRTFSDEDKKERILDTSPLRSLFALTAVRLSVILLLATTTVVAQDAPWKLGVRNVPTPAGVSETLHDSIRASAQPDVQARKNVVPKNDEQWYALIEARSKQRAVPLGDRSPETGPLRGEENQGRMLRSKSSSANLVELARLNELDHRYE